MSSLMSRKQRRKKVILLRDSGISAGSSQSEAKLFDNFSDAEETRTIDHLELTTNENNTSNSGEDVADIELSSSDDNQVSSFRNNVSPNTRRKLYRKSRKRKTPKEDDNAGDDTTSAEDEGKHESGGDKCVAHNTGNHRRKSTCSFQLPVLENTSSNRATRLFFQPPVFHQHRAQSSPSQLLIQDAELLRKVQDTFSACSTPIKLLENRRKYAPLTPAGRDRPKLLATGNGLISIEPIFRKSLSIGSLVKGTNISLDLNDIKGQKSSLKGQDEKKQTLIGSPKRSSKQLGPLVPMGKSKLTIDEPKGQERPKKAAASKVSRSTNKKQKINLDFKPETSTSSAQMKTKVMSIKKERPKVAKEDKSTKATAPHDPQLIESEKRTEDNSDNDDDDQGLILPPLAEKRSDEVHKGQDGEDHEKEEGQTQAGDTREGLDIADTILKNVKEMRKGVQPKEIQEKIKISNEVVIPKATNAVRIEKKVQKALAKQGLTKGQVNVESPKRSLTRSRTSTGQLNKYERKRGISVRSSRYPTETEDFFDIDTPQSPTMDSLNKNDLLDLDLATAEEVFEADNLPNYAKSYILPRKMQKSSVEARKSKKSVQNPLDLDSDDQEENEAKLKAFKLSMLKTSLEHDVSSVMKLSNLSNPSKKESKKIVRDMDDKEMVEKSDFKTLKTLKLARAAVEKWKNKVEASKLMTKISANLAVNSPGKKSRKVSTKSLSSPTARSRLISESGSGRNSRMMTRNTSMKSLVPCSGPGSLQDYSAYVKSGGFVPGLILDPEEGIEAAIFAKNKAIEYSFNNDSGFSTAGFLDEGQDVNGVKVHGGGHLETAASSIEKQFEAIKKAYGLPKEDNTRLTSVAEESMAGSGAMTPKESVINKAVDRLSRPKKGQEVKPVRKEKKADLLLDFDGPSSSTNNSSSGYATNESSNNGSDLFGMDDSFFKAKTDDRLYNDAMAGNNLLAFVEEPKARFGDDLSPRGRRGSRHGSALMDFFVDPTQIFASERHPALQEVLSVLSKSKMHRAEKLRLQEELFRLRSVRKDGEAKKEHLLNRARVLQARAMSHKAKLAGLWEEKLKEEQVKTGPLEEVCAALREALDAEHKKRMEAFETKMKPIIVKDGPSRKANYKIAAAKLYYEIYSLSQRLRLTTIRVEHEEARRERVEREVKKLRDEISVKKTAVTTATKGIPVNKIEVRPQDQQPNYSGPSNMINPMLVGLSNEAQMILASNFHMNSVLGSPSKLPALPGFPSLEFQDGPSPQPPSNNYLIQPRSAKISMEEAAEAANKLASTNNDNSFKSYNEGASASKLPNGRPPQAIQGAI